MSKSTPRPSVQSSSALRDIRALRVMYYKTVSGTVTANRYKLAKVFDCDRDPSKSWFVAFYYEYPDRPNTYKRFRIKAGLNRIKNVRERSRQFRLLKEAINELLRSGWSPFVLSEYAGTKWERIDVALRYLLTVKKQAVEKRTYQSYSNVIDRFIEWMELGGVAHYPPDHITRRHINEYLDGLTSSGLSNNTRNNHLNYIRSFFSSLYSHEVIDRNPASNIKKLTVVYGEKNIPTTDDETQRIVDFLEGQHPMMFLFVNLIYGCGLRPAEICRLKVGDIDIARGEILISGTVAKAHKRDHVVMPEYLISIIGPIIDGHKVSDAIFGTSWKVGPKAMQRNEPTKLWKILIKDGLGIQKDMYGLRHKSSIDMHESGFNVFEIRDRLRHASVTQTEQYMRSIASRNKTRLRNNMPQLGNKTENK